MGLNGASLPLIFPTLLMFSLQSCSPSEMKMILGRQLGWVMRALNKSVFPPSVTAHFRTMTAFARHCLAPHYDLGRNTCKVRKDTNPHLGLVVSWIKEALSAKTLQSVSLAPGSFVLPARVHRKVLGVQEACLYVQRKSICGSCWSSRKQCP